MNSILVVLVMAVVVALILMRTVRKDLAKYEELLVETSHPADLKDEVCLGGLPFYCCSLALVGIVLPACASHYQGK